MIVPRDDLTREGFALKFAAGTGEGREKARRERRGGEAGAALRYEIP